MPLFPFSVDAGLDIHYRPFERPFHGAASENPSRVNRGDLDPGLSAAGIDHARSETIVSQAPLGTPLAAG